MLQLGRQGQLYGIEEVTYGTTPALSATNAVRHREFLAPFDNNNKRTTNEKRQSPLINASMRSPTRKTAEFSYKGILRPSGTLNTLPEVDFMLKAAMGARSNVTLSTTVSSGGSVSGATLASAAGLTQLIDFVLITCPDGRKRLRRLLTIAGAVVTWAPNLPTGQQPANGAAVKGVVTYRMISAANPSLSFAHYLKKTDLSAGLKRNVKGGAPDKLAIKFDPNDDVEMTLSGMAKEVVDAPAQPGGFTMVGGTPASIQAGELLLGNNAAQFLALNFELTNGLWARNDEYGVTAASEIIRRNDPALAVNLNTRVEDETLLFDLTEAGTNVGVFCQTDFTEGKAIAVYMPTVEFMPPRTDDPMEEVKWDFSGVAFETADLALDGLYIALG